MTQHGKANGDGPDDQLDRAFEELRGVLTDKQHPGIGIRVLDWIWPF